MRPTYHRHCYPPAAVVSVASALLALVSLSTLSGQASAGTARRTTTSRAASSTTLVIAGAGEGHGVGMSQDGALGYAEHGYSYRAILAHYYTGTALGQASPATVVRVLLAGNRRRASFSGADRAGGQALDPSRTYTVASSHGAISLTGPGVRALAPSLSISGPGPLMLKGTAENGLANGSYRGAFSVVRAVHGGINVVNAVALEDYVRGTVAAEVPAGWPAAALQAQAVASRTYAITGQASLTGGGFDLYCDTRSQMYRGVSGETTRTTAAAAATAGQIVTYRGQPAVTYFFASSGGRTENVQDAFAGSSAQPWLRGVVDPFDRHRWMVSMSFANAAARLGGLVRGSFKGIEVLRRGSSPRVLFAYVLGSGGRTLISGADLAARLGLSGTWAYFSVRGAHGERPEPDLSGRPQASPPSGFAPEEAGTGAAPSGEPAVAGGVAAQ